MTASTVSKPSVLFVCVKNGGKSQMAAALLRHRAGAAIDVHSAGTKPGSALNPLSVEAVAEVNADMSSERPKAIDSDLLRRVDRVILLGRQVQIDPVEGMTATIETWNTDEPSDRGITGIERMRMVRDDINARVQDLYQALINN